MKESQKPGPADAELSPAHEPSPAHAPADDAHQPDELAGAAPPPEHAPLAYETAGAAPPPEHAPLAYDPAGAAPPPPPYGPNAYPPGYGPVPMPPGYPPQAPHPHAPHPQMMHPQMALRSHPPGVPIPAPPSHGGPYRVPLAPEAPVFPGFPPARPPRPILGSAVAVYGVLLWSFVIAGQFATSWITGAPMSHGLAAFLVLAATTTAWVFALRRSRDALPSMTTGRFVGRGIGVLTLAFAFFVLTILVATLFGQATSGHDFLIAFTLVAASLAAIIMGPRLTLPRRPERTHRMRFAVISMWIVGVILTFVAAAELATTG